MEVSDNMSLLRPIMEQSIWIFKVLFSSLLLFLWRIREEVKTSEKSLLEGKEVATQHWLDYEHKVNK